jgi:hypothetical protein
MEEVRQITGQLYDNLETIQKRNVELRKRLNDYEKRYNLFFYLFIISLICLIIQHFVLNYIHRGDMLRIHETYISMHNERLDAMKLFIDKLYLSPMI